MPAPKKYSDELKQRAVRMVFQIQRESGKDKGAIAGVADKLGINRETLRNWVRQSQVDAGARPGRAGWGEDAPERWGTLGAGDDMVRVPTERGAYQEFYARLAAALTSNAPLPVDTAHAVRTLDVIDAIRTML